MIIRSIISYVSKTSKTKIWSFKQLRMAQGDTNSAKREAQEAYDKALMLRNMTQGSSDMFSDLLRRMEDFQNQRGARPAEIRAVRSFYTTCPFILIFTNIYTQKKKQVGKPLIDDNYFLLFIFHIDCGRSVADEYFPHTGTNPKPRAAD